MPKRTWHRPSPVRRETVLTAVMDGFGTHGYFIGSLNVIAREAGGSLFQHFSGKLVSFICVAEQPSLRIYAPATTPEHSPLSPLANRLRC
ncbi:hypothetical protein ACN6K9_005219 [Streptomyces sp. SAS_267]|uniref:hypothetical protein n=1 Tax=unclassified Streptomyces TaxID=2593676 RepID=UPI0036F9C5A8